MPSAALAGNPAISPPGSAGRSGGATIVPSSSIAVKSLPLWPDSPGATAAAGTFGTETRNIPLPEKGFMLVTTFCPWCRDHDIRKLPVLYPVLPIFGKIATIGVLRCRT
jgi:hypothetical protein